MVLPWGYLVLCVHDYLLCVNHPIKNLDLLAFTDYTIIGLDPHCSPHIYILTLCCCYCLMHLQALNGTVLSVLILWI